MGCQYFSYKEANSQSDHMTGFLLIYFCFKVLVKAQFKLNYGKFSYTSHRWCYWQHHHRCLWFYFELYGLTTAVLCLAVGTLGSLLPDIDLDHSKPASQGF